MAAKSRARAFAFAFWGAGVVAACVVPNVDLVEKLPGDAAAGESQSGSTAGKASHPSGGDTDVIGGESSTGPDSGGSSSGRSGAANGGSSGGTAPTTGGTAPSTAGSSSTGGKGGAGGGPTVWAFSGKGACDTAQPAGFCDDFEQSAGAKWPPGPLWTTPAINGAPSGTHAMRTGFHAAPMNYSPGAADFNLSFWVRFPTKTDQAFVSWGINGVALTFGLEGSSFRFRLDQNPPTVAPELDKYTRGAVVDQWTCIEIDKVAATFQPTVTVFGDAPFKLAPVGGTTDAGIDQALLNSIPGKAININQSTWTLGETGTDIEIDDVRIVGAGLASVCQDFIDANQ